VQLMNTQIISVTEECPLMSTAEIMVNKGKHPLAVLRGNRLVGTNDRTDVIRTLLESGNATQEGRYRLFRFYTLLDLYFVEKISASQLTTSVLWYPDFAG